MRRPWPTGGEAVTAKTNSMWHKMTLCTLRIEKVAGNSNKCRSNTKSKSNPSPLHFFKIILQHVGPGSSVGIATELRDGRSGIESRWGRDFPPVQTGSGANQASCKMGTGSFPGVKCSQGVPLTTHSLLVQRSWKSRAILLHNLWATPGL